MNRGSLPSNANLNNYYGEANVGVWYVGATTSMSNLPPSPNDYGHLIVLYSGGMTNQTMVRNQRIYSRQYSGSPITWTSWYTYEGGTV